MFNIFVLVFMAVAAGFVIAAFVTRNSSPSKEDYLLAEEDAENDNTDGITISLDQLEQLARSLCDEKNLEVKEKLINSDNEIVLIAENPDPILNAKYVFGCFTMEGDQKLMTLADVLEFKDFVRGTKSSRGLLFTNGFFSRDVYQPLEGVEVQLFNRKKVLAELAKRQPEKS